LLALFGPSLALFAVGAGEVTRPAPQLDQQPAPIEDKPTGRVLRLQAQDVTRALSLQVSADNSRAIAKSQRGKGNLTAAGCREIEADEMDLAAAEILIPAEPLEIGIGGELVPTAENMEADSAPAVFDTLKTSPDMLNATASRERLNLAAAAGALMLGTDIAETIKVRNSLERMLAHQLGAVHLMAMKFSEQATQHLRSHYMQSDAGRFAVGRGPDEGRNLQALLVEASRAANTATRLMLAFQDGLVAFERIRRGGKQTVKVVHVHQHVAVADGGQAVVAGTVKGRGHRGTPRGPDAPREFPPSTRARASEGREGAAHGKSDRGCVSE
jgi:hypothetical protein